MLKISHCLEEKFGNHLFFLPCKGGFDEGGGTGGSTLLVKKATLWLEENEKYCTINYICVSIFSEEVFTFLRKYLGSGSKGDMLQVPPKGESDRTDELGLLWLGLRTKSVAPGVKMFSWRESIIFISVPSKIAHYIDFLYITQSLNNFYLISSQQLALIYFLRCKGVQSKFVR